MPYKKYKLWDNAWGKLQTSVNTTATTIVLSESENLPDGNAVLTLVKFWPDPIDNTKVIVTSREKIYAGTITGGLTITGVTRAYDGDIAHTFDAGDYIFLNVTKEVIEDIQDELTRVAAEAALKANAADVYTKTENDTLLAAKANASSLSNYQLTSQKNQANGYVGLDGSGKIPATALPNLAINDTFVVASQAAMLALDAQRGDMAIRTDENKTYILSSDSPSTLADWKALNTQYAHGHTIAEITGLQTALDSKVSLTGNQTIAWVKTFTNALIGAGGFLSADHYTSNSISFMNAAYTTSYRHINKIANASSFDLNFAESGVADYRLYLKKGWSIGVNTNNPLANFHVLGNQRIQHNDWAVALYITWWGGGAAENGVLYVKSESSWSWWLTRYVARFANNTSDILLISNDSKLNITGQIVQTFTGESIALKGGAAQTWMSYYNGATRQGYVGTYASGNGLVVNCDVGPLTFWSPSAYNAWGFDFNGGRIKKPYQTATGGGGGSLVIGSRYEISNIQHGATGHVLQVLRWDAVANPEGAGNDGGRGIAFWQYGNPFLKMIADNVQIWRTGGTINIQSIVYLNTRATAASWFAIWRDSSGFLRVG